MLAQSVMIFIRCVTVNSLFLKPCCSLIKILFLAMCFAMRLSIICSIILQHIHVCNVGLWFEGSDFKPFLKMGVAIAEFQSLTVELRL